MSWCKRCAVLACLAVLVSGCMAIPFPHTKTVAPGLSGQVWDSETHKPIANARVTRFGEQAWTDDMGRFEIDRQDEIHWFILLMGDYFFNEEATFAHSQYETVRRSWSHCCSGDFGSSEIHVDIGNVYLERVEAE